MSANFSLNDAKSVLVTGGTGSFGRLCVRTILERYPNVQRVVVFSRDELKQFEMAQEIGGPRVRYFLGDVRDANRLQRAMEHVDVVIHAAALKQVPAAEYNPFEAVKTNILGAQNVIEAAMDQGVRRVVALSTDKACAPINLYGATKLCSDKLFVAANSFKGARDLRLSVVRYGNVLGSRGSVIPFFLKQRAAGALSITHPEMTRFSITLQEGVDIVLESVGTMWGGEIHVPKIPSYRILDVARAIAPSARHDVVGVRPGEKLHEEMISQSDALACVELSRHYVILPSTPTWTFEAFCEATGARPCDPSFRYDSGTNDTFLSVDQIRDLIRNHVDATFSAGIS